MKQAHFAIAIAALTVATTAYGDLSPSYVQHGVMAHARELRACYEAVPRATPGTVTVAWEIDPTGTVHNAHIVKTTIANAAVGNCVVAQVDDWKFEAIGVHVTVTSYPFTFGSQPANAHAH